MVSYLDSPRAQLTNEQHLRSFLKRDLTDPIHHRKAVSIAMRAEIMPQVSWLPEGREKQSYKSFCLPSRRQV